MSPANGQPIAIPSQDIVLGCYYLTKEKKGTRGEGRAFACAEDVLIALEHKEVETLTPIRLMYSGELVDLTTVYDDQDVIHTEVQNVKNQIINTTVGRVIFNDHLPRDAPTSTTSCARRAPKLVVQLSVPGRTVGCWTRSGPGFQLRHRAGVDRHRHLVIRTEEEVGFSEGSDRRREAVPRRRHRNGRRYNRSSPSGPVTKVADAIFRGWAQDQRRGVQPDLHMPLGSRGGKQQIRQLAGMRGLMGSPARSSGITSNFREGPVLQYFISYLAKYDHRAQDRGLRLPPARLVTWPGCDHRPRLRTGRIDIRPIIESGEVIEPLRDRSWTGQPETSGLRGR
jgi:DNA-directed RNA polymerase subunit beta'